MENRDVSATKQAGHMKNQNTIHHCSELEYSSHPAAAAIVPCPCASVPPLSFTSSILLGQWLRSLSPLCNSQLSFSLCLPCFRSVLLWGFCWRLLSVHQLVPPQSWVSSSNSVEERKCLDLWVTVKYRDPAPELLMDLTKMALLVLAPTAGQSGVVPVMGCGDREWVRKTSETESWSWETWALGLIRYDH